MALFNCKRTLKVAVNAKVASGPWGGGNQWLQQLSRMAAYQNISLCSSLSSGVDVAIVLHTANQPEATFGLQDVIEWKTKYRNRKVLHRINENDARKNTSHVDSAIEAWNKVADYTVFVSTWLKQYHSDRWFDGQSKPNEVVLNGADSRFFHPVGSSIWDKSKPLILVTHHWSDHWNKGFDLYQQIDETIDEGKLNGVELWIVGRWPKQIEWKTAKTFEACSGLKLGSLLRKAHVYVTGTKAEPGAMHYIEGLQCGLPLMYREGGGGVEEVGAIFNGIKLSGDLCQDIASVKADYSYTRQKLLSYVPSGERMSNRYLEICRTIVSDVSVYEK